MNLIINDNSTRLQLVTIDNTRGNCKHVDRQSDTVRATDEHADIEIYVYLTMYLSHVDQY